VADSPATVPGTGTWTGYEINGRKRLVPAFGTSPSGEASIDAVRDFVAELARRSRPASWQPRP